MKNFILFLFLFSFLSDLKAFKLIKTNMNPVDSNEEARGLKKELEKLRKNPHLQPGANALEASHFRQNYSPGNKKIKKIPETLKRKNSLMKKKFFEALKRSDLKEIERLYLENRKLIHTRDKYADSPLHISSGLDFNVSKFLIQHGADVNAQNNYGERPIHVSSSFSYEITQLLIKSGALINPKDKLGIIPFHYAVMKNQLKTVKLLFQKTDINLKTHYSGDSPLHYAVMKGYLEMAKYLIQKGADVNAQNAEGESLLMTAVIKEDMSLVRLLFDHNALLNLEDHRGERAFDKILTVEDPRIEILFKQKIKEQNKLNKIDLKKAPVRKISRFSRR